MNGSHIQGNLDAQNPAYRRASHFFFRPGRLDPGYIQYYIQTRKYPGIVMPPIANIKSISYLKSHAAQISEELEMNGNPFFITQNGDASMVIESVKRYQEKEALIAALKIMALGEKDRLQGKGISAAAARSQLLVARKSR